MYLNIQLQKVATMTISCVLLPAVTAASVGDEVGDGPEPAS